MVGRRGGGALQDHARADGDVGHAIDDDERTRAVVAAIAVEGDRLIEPHLAAADFVERELLGFLAVERVDVDAIANRRKCCRTPVSTLA